MITRKAPSLADIEALAARALETIPDEFKRHLGPLVIRVDEFPDEETEERWSSTARSTLGLYAARCRRNVTAPRTQLDMVFLYAGDPRLWCESGEDLAHVVRHVLITKSGTIFGFSEPGAGSRSRLTAAAGGVICLRQ